MAAARPPRPEPGNTTDVTTLLRIVERLRTRFSIDQAKVEAETRFDGKWVLRT